ncbi:RNA-binding 7-like [Olea europaea subsp. europaea]|uniref:RNA-binding 7-like n=1 Tax=Olea europaea subsp. europaea TaxID=158383 RepID=A0A8S0TNT7_OLEEU|nr:RNA-binding 7-like [Olea europaea subsp. europaea]
MSLQERTVVVRGFDPDKTTEALLKELCMQAGPVRKVVLRPDHAFVEYDDIESVGYCKALLGGTVLFGRPLSFEPKLREPIYQKYTKALNDYIRYDKNCRLMEQQRQYQQQHQQQQQHQHQQQLQMQYQYPMQMQQQPQPQRPSHLQQQSPLGAEPQFYQSQVMQFNQYQPPPHRPPNGFYR